MIMKLILALLCLMTTLARADAVECATKRVVDNTYWQYRLIDGRKCWYPGKHTRQKSELQWMAEVAPMRAPEAAPAPSTQATVLDFTTRWVDLPPPRELPQQVYDRLDDDVSAGQTFFAPVRSGGFDAAMLYTEPPRNMTAVTAASMSTAGSSLMILGWLFLASSIIAAATSLRSL